MPSNNDAKALASSSSDKATALARSTNNATARAESSSTKTARQPTSSTVQSKAKAPTAYSSNKPGSVLSFAIFKSYNQEAKDIHSNAWDYVDSNNDRYHRSYMQKYPRTNHSSTRVATSRPPISRAPENDVVFAFRYDLPPHKPSVGWQLGRGSAGNDPFPSKRGVEFLACNPNIPWEREQFEPVECIFRLHPLSGLLMLEKGSPRAEVAYFVDGTWIVLGSEGKSKTHVLFYGVNLIRIGKELLYELSYTTGSRAEHTQQEYHRKWHFETQLHETPPNIRMWGLPPNRCSIVLHSNGTAQVVRYEITYTGRGYTLSRGLELDTGMPLLIKETSCSGQVGTQALVEKEFRLHREFKVLDPYHFDQIHPLTSYQAATGIHVLRKSWCDHQKTGATLTEPCLNMSDIVFMTFPLGLMTFNQFRFSTANSDIIYGLAQSTLRGIQSLRKKSIVYGEIISNNMLIMSTTFPYAVIMNITHAERGGVS